MGMFGREEVRDFQGRAGEKTPWMRRTTNERTEVS
jgi:hypothetical protein